MWNSSPCFAFPAPRAARRGPRRVNPDRRSCAAERRSALPAGARRGGGCRDPGRGHAPDPGCSDCGRHREARGNRGLRQGGSDRTPCDPRDDPCRDLDRGRTGASTGTSYRDWRRDQSWVHARDRACGDLYRDGGDAHHLRGVAAAARRTERPRLQVPEPR